MQLLFVAPVGYVREKLKVENKIPQKGVESEGGLRHEYDCPAS